MKKLLLATAVCAMASQANAAVVTSFSSLGSPTILPLGATPVVDFFSLAPGDTYNSGAIYNAGGGTTSGITNPSSFVAAPWRQPLRNRRDRDIVVGSRALNMGHDAARWPRLCWVSEEPQTPLDRGLIADNIEDRMAAREAAFLFETPPACAIRDAKHTVNLQPAQRPQKRGRMASPDDRTRLPFARPSPFMSGTLPTATPARRAA
jgi:hypothetical protein